MAQHDQDEYKFDEFDSLGNESMDDTELGTGDSQPPSGGGPKPPQNDVKRNAMIVVGVIIFVMLMYKLIGGLFSHKANDAATKGNIPPAPVAEMAPQQPQPLQQPQPMQSAIAPPPIQPAAPQENNSALKQKIDVIESNQQSVQTQITSMNEQVGNVNNNVNNLTAQISRLNQTITDLTNQLSRQSEEINVLMLRTKPAPVKKILPPGAQRPVNVYYINAVIPGRAWLIGTNGSTLTVREGTKISGYGVVKLIDSMEGRVVTSSGRVIRFSQNDS